MIMKTTFSFSIISLLTMENDKISGPMSPMLFVKEMSANMNEKYNRLARVHFDDEKIHQQYENGGLTGHDTLILANQYTNDLYLSLWVDIGAGGIPVAICFESDKQTIVTQVYKRKTFARKLTRPEIQQIFQYIFDNPSSLAIKTVT